MLRLIKKVVGVAISLLLIVFVFFVIVALYYAKDLPDPQRILAGGFKESTKIYDRTGTVMLYQIGQERREVVNSNQLPQHVKWATIVAEDDEFYRHPGVDPLAVFRALWKNLTRGALIQGGSTITQQFVKNALLSPEKTFSRKIKEAILSLWIEATYSKDEILSLYLNQIPYGSNAYGIASAAQTFFGKSSQDLTIGEAALLAALPQRPSYLSPYGEHRNELKLRQESIIDRMVNKGYITPGLGRQAKEEDIRLERGVGSILAPHFVMYVKEYLEKTYGPERVEQGGLTVITSLDWRLQEKAQALVTEQAKKNQKTFRAKNAALVALDPNTGQVLAMVGSRDWFDDAIDGKVNVALRLRQPGSAFKPIAYAKLFEKGFGPESLIFDLETIFQTRALKEYTPRNFDGKFRGLLTLRQALSQSINVAAVKTLYLAGIDEVITLANQMGVNTIDPGRVDLALVLGGAEVRLLDLSTAYGVFASDGIFNPPAIILKIKDKEGKTLEEFVSRSKRILNPEIARLITSILSDNESRAAMFGPSSPLFVPGLATAAKTGTTTNFRDGWTMGYTPNLVVGVWAGNNGPNEYMVNGEGAFVAGPIWNKLISFAAKTFPQEFGGSFPDPLPHLTLDLPMVNGALISERVARIDKYSGKLATDLTPPLLIEERPYREVHSLLYYLRPDDPQLLAWEEAVKRWALSSPDALLYSNSPPQGYDDVHVPANTPKITIRSPLPFSSTQSSLRVEIAVATVFPLKQVEIALDQELIKTASSADPFEIDISELAPGSHSLTIKVFDEALNSAQEKVEFVKT